MMKWKRYLQKRYLQYILPHPHAKRKKTCYSDFMDKRDDGFSISRVALITIDFNVKVILDNFAEKQVDNNKNISQDVKH